MCFLFYSSWWKMAPFKLDFDKVKHSGKMMLDKSILPVDDMLYASFSGVGRTPALDLENLPLFTGFHTSQDFWPINSMTTTNPYSCCQEACVVYRLQVRTVGVGRAEFHGNLRPRQVFGGGHRSRRTATENGKMETSKAPYLANG